MTDNRREQLEHRRKAARLAVVAACVLVGMAYRLGISARAPVSYDEVFVMALGLDEMVESARAFFIDVPLRRSNAVAPLWWWVQALPTLVSGEVSLLALRIMPLLLGGAALVLAYACAAPRVGHGPAVMFIAFAALSDVLAFTNARGEYAESLLVALVMPAVALTGRTRSGSWRTGLLKVSLWALLPLTHLGKGLFLLLGLALADLIVRSRLEPFAAAARRILAILALAAVPALVWLGIAAAAVAGRAVETDIGLVQGPLDMLRALTIDYSRTKAHMVASPWAALQIWRDPWAWPLTCVSAPFLLVGLIAALAQRRGRRGRLALALAVWIALGFLLVVGRSMIGARFHLLYLPPLWLVAAIGFHGLGRTMKRRDSVLSPQSSVLSRLPTGLASPLVLLAGGGVLLLAAARGPLRWAPFARFEPYAGSEELAAIDTHRREQAPLPGGHGRTLYIDLANYFLVKEAPSPRDRTKAVEYAEKEIRRAPEDARAWFYLAKARQAAGQPPGSVLEAARRSQHLRPSPQATELVRQLSGEGLNGHR